MENHNKPKFEDLVKNKIIIEELLKTAPEQQYSINMPSFERHNKETMKEGFSSLGQSY